MRADLDLGGGTVRRDRHEGHVLMAGFAKAARDRGAI